MAEVFRHILGIICECGQETVVEFLSMSNVKEEEGSKTVSWEYSSTVEALWFVRFIQRKL